jgi:hypothetical protein
MLSVLGLVACRPSEPTPLSEVVIQIDADTLVQQAGDTLVVEISSGASVSELMPSDPETYDLRASDFSWPVTITLVAKPSHEDHVFALNLRLEKNGVVLARGRVQSGFAKGRTLVLQKMLGAECLGKLDCPENETCVVNDGRASCESAAIDPDDLPTQIPKSDAGATPRDAGQGDASAVTDAGSEPGPGTDAATSDAGFDASGCSALGPEDCQNGLDDDCNGLADCADSACEPVTQCVPDAFSFVIVGLEENCPPGYQELDIVNQDLKDNGCDGCSCQANAKECEAYVNVYGSQLGCSRDATNTGGTMLSKPATATCSAPIGKDIALPMGGFGFNVHVQAGKDSCEASGDAKLTEPVWGATLKRCHTELQRGGCVLGYCAPKPEAKELCWPEPEAGCGAIGSARAYYQGYDDTRSCEACSCTAKGGSCSDVGATITTDPTCRSPGTVLRDSEKSCESISSEAMVRGTGKPRDPECTAKSVQNGSLIATGTVNLCCGGPALGL